MTATAGYKKAPRRKAAVPAPRKNMSVHSAVLAERFALHLREILDKKGWGPKDFHEAFEAAGYEVPVPTIKRWLAGRGFPNTPMLVPMAEVLGIADYRKVLPPPVR